MIFGKIGIHYRGEVIGLYKGVPKTQGDLNNGWNRGEPKKPQDFAAFLEIIERDTKTVIHGSDK